jgi:hypothetical protein
MNYGNVEASKQMNEQENTNPRLGLVSRAILEQWLSQRVRVDGDCWIWRMAVCKSNQPRAALNGKTSLSVRRYAWQCCHPKGVNQADGYARVTLTTCGEPLCVRPDHVVLRSKSDAQKLHHKRHGTYATPAMVAKRAKTLRANRIGARIADQVRANRAAGMTYRQLAEKHSVALGTIQRILSPKVADAANGSSVFAWRPAA